MQPFYEDSEQEPASAKRSFLPQVESDRAVLTTGPSFHVVNLYLSYERGSQYIKVIPCKAARSQPINHRG